MKVDRKALMAALKAISPVVERRNTIPILSHAMLRAAGGALHMQTTDLDITATTSIPCEGGFDTTLGNLSGLYALLKAADGDEVALTAVEAGPEAGRSSGKIEISSGALSALVTPGHPDDFPTIPRQRKDWSATAGADFMAALARVSIAVSREETRYYLNGIYFHHVADWTYRLVATDGHRLVYANVELPDASGDMAGSGPGDTLGHIIPRKMLANMVRLHKEDRAAPVKLAFGPCMLNDQGKPLEGGGGPARLSVGIGGTTLVGKLIDGAFPDYKRVVPAEGVGPHRAKVKTADVRRAFGALGAFTTERTKAVKLVFEKSRIVLSTISPQNGTASIAIDAETDGSPYEIGFNAGYMIAMAAVTGGEFMHLESTGAWAPCRVTDPDSTSVVTVLMPMRV